MRHMLGSHGPGEVPKQCATAFDTVKNGECAVASIGLARLLGRQLEGFEETMRNMING